MKNVIAVWCLLLSMNLYAENAKEIFSENFENPANAARWKMTGQEPKNKRYALARFLTVDGRKCLSLQDFEWGGNVMATAETPDFPLSDTWKVEYNMWFKPVQNSKKNKYHTSLLLLAQDGKVIEKIPVHYNDPEQSGWLAGKIQLQNEREYRIQLTMKHNDGLYDIEITGPDGTVESLKKRKLENHLPLAGLRFEAVPGQGNMGIMNIRNLKVSTYGVPKERKIDSLGILENNKLRLNFSTDGEVIIKTRSTAGKWKKIGVLAAPVLPGDSPGPVRFAGVRLANDNPSLPRVDYDQIATATQVAGSGNKVFGIAAFGADGKRLYLMQWTLFPEGARLRVYPEGEISKNWNRNIAAIPFSPEKDMRQTAAFSPERMYFHRTGGEPEQVQRGQVLEFGDGTSFLSCGINGEMPNFWNFFKDGKFHFEIKEVSLPFSKDFYCGTLAFSIRDDQGARRREVLARSGDERILLEVSHKDPFFLIKEPGIWRGTAHVGHYFRKKQRIEVSYRAFDYHGNRLAEKTLSAILAEGEEQAFPIEVKIENPGPVYIEVTANHEFAGDFVRVCGGVLPEYTFKAGEDSRIGIAAFRGDVGPHTELRTPEQMLKLMKRIGISLIRQCYGNEKLAHSLGIRSWYANDIRGSEVGRNYMRGDKKTWLSNQEQREKFITANLETTHKAGSLVFEFSNEWNLVGGEMKAACAELYAKDWLPLLKKVRDEKFPEIKLAGLSIANGDMPYMDVVYRNGGWDMFDYLAFHASGVPRAPENKNGYWCYLSTLEAVRSALRKYGDKPLYMSELYVPVAPNLSLSNNERISADDLVLQIALATALDVKNIMLYCFDDFDRPQWSGRKMPEPQERERYFGLVRRNWVPKATLWAYATAARFFDPGEFLGDIEFKEPGAKGLLFDNGPNGKFALLWSRKDGIREHEIAAPQLFHRAPWIATDVSPPTNLRLKALNHVVRITDAVGIAATYKADDSGYVTIPLTESPVYVEGAELQPVEGYFFKMLSPKG